MNGPHQNLFVADGLNKSFHDMTTFCMLAILAYKPVETPTISAIAQWLGYTNLNFYNTNQELIPNLLVGTDSDGIIVAIQGTASWQQGMFYTLVSELVDAPAFGPDVRIQSGFLFLFEAILGQIQSIIVSMSESVPISFTGHSLGGAVAQMLAVWFRRNTNRPVANCVVVATPKVGNRLWIFRAEAVPVLSIRRESDYIPQFPPDAFWSTLFQLGGDQPTSSLYFGDLARELVFDEGLPFEYRGRNFNDNAAVTAVNRFWNMLALDASDPQLLSWQAAHDPTNYVTALASQREGISNPTQNQRTQTALMQALVESWPSNVAEPVVTDAFLRQLMVNAGVTPPPPPPPAPLPAPVQQQIIVPSHVRIDLEARYTQFRTDIIWRSYIQPTGMVDHTGAGGSFRPFWLFRGLDRRMLLALRQVLSAIVVRDNAMAALVREGASSPPPFIIDPADDALFNAFWQISNQVDMMLRFQQRSTL